MTQTFSLEPSAPASPGFWQCRGQGRAQLQVEFPSKQGDFLGGLLLVTCPGCLIQLPWGLGGHELWGPFLLDPPSRILWAGFSGVSTMGFKGNRRQGQARTCDLLTLISRESGWPVVLRGGVAVPARFWLRELHLPCLPAGSGDWPSAGQR